MHVVQRAGLEPAQELPHEHLKLARLPSYAIAAWYRGQDSNLHDLKGHCGLNAARLPSSATPAQSLVRNAGIEPAENSLSSYRVHQLTRRALSDALCNRVVEVAPAPLLVLSLSNPDPQPPRAGPAHENPLVVGAPRRGMRASTASEAAHGAPRFLVGGAPGNWTRPANLSDSPRQPAYRAPFHFTSLQRTSHRTSVRASGIEPEADGYKPSCGTPAARTGRRCEE